MKIKYGPGPNPYPEEAWAKWRNDVDVGLTIILNRPGPNEEKMLGWA